MANTKAVIDIDINTSSAAAGLRQLQSQINAFNSTLTKSSAAQATVMRNAKDNLMELVNASRFFRAETVKMTTGAAALDKTLAKGQVTLGQYFKSFQRGSLESARVMSLANTRAAALQTQFIATGAAANGMRDAIAIRPLQEFNKQAVVSAQKLAIQRAMLNQATTSMINFGKNTQWAGRQLMVGFTVPLSIFGAMAGKTFMDLEKQAVNFKKVYGDSFTPPAEMEANLKAVQELGREYTKYGIAVKDTVGLAAEAAAAGAQNKDLIDATTQATRLATLGQMEQNQALETTISLQNAFKLSGDDLAKSVNFLNMVENQTVVTLQDLSAAIPRVAPVIKGLGGDVEDLAAFLAAMQEGGVSAEQGANALKSGLASLINPTNKAIEKLDEMGISLNAIIQTNRGDLMGTVQGFADALDTLDQFSRQQALEQVFGKFQYARLGALFDNINKAGTQAGRVLDLAGMSAQEMGASAEKELSAIEESAGTKLVAAMEKLKLAIAPVGEMFVQIATPIVNLLATIAEKFNGLPDFAKKFIGLGTVITGIVIPAGTMFLGLLMNLVGTLVKFGNIVGLAFKGFISGGFKGAFDNVSQALRYMSLEEIDAANAAQQLAGSTEAVNLAFRDQVGSAESAKVAIGELAYSYEVLQAQMRETAAMQKLVFGTGAAAMGNAGGRSPRPRGYNKGGNVVPGTGNTDTVPAILTPGEFVVNKKAAKENRGLLDAINSGQTRHLNGGNEAQRALRARQGSNLLGGMSPTERFSGEAFGIENMSESLIRRINRSSRNVLQQYGYSGSDLGIIKEFGAGVVTLPSKMNNRLRSGKARVSDVRAEFEKHGPLKELFSVPNVGGNSSQRRLIEASIVKQLQGMRGTISDADLETIVTKAFVETGNKEILRNIDKMGLGARRSGFLTGSGAAGVAVGMNVGDERGYAGFFRRVFEDAGVTNWKVEKEETISERTGKKRTRLAYVFEDPENPGTFYRTVPGRTRDASDLSYQRVVPSREKRGRVGFARSHFRLPRMRFNSGGQVMQRKGGSVPAMLTPGEYIVGKEATQSNRALLEAINNGQIKGYELGGMVEALPGQYLVEGRNGRTFGPYDYDRALRRSKQLVSARARRSIKPTSNRTSSRGMGGMRGMGASMGLGMAGGALMMGSSMMPNESAAGAMNAAGMAMSLGSILPMMGSAALPVAGFAALAATTTAVVMGMNRLKGSLSEVDNAFLGSTEKVKNMAAAFGRQTNVEKLGIMRAQSSGGGITQESYQAAGGFIDSEAGKQLLSDLRLLQKTGRDQIQGLTNQLSRSILSGAINTEEARAIAVQVGQALGDQKIGVRVSAKISEMYGVDGRLLQNNRIDAVADIVPKIDMDTLDQEAEATIRELGRVDWSRGFDLSAAGMSIVTLGGNFVSETMKMEASLDALSNAAQEAAMIEKEARAGVLLEYKNGITTLEQYRQKLDELSEMDISGSSTRDFLSGLAELGTSQLLDAEIKNFTITDEMVRGGVDVLSQISDRSIGEQNTILNQINKMNTEYVDRLNESTRAMLEEANYSAESIDKLKSISQEIAGSEFGGGRAQAAEIFQGLGMGEFDPVIIDKIMEMSAAGTLDKLVPEDISDKAKYLKDLGYELATFAAYPDLQESMFNIMITETRNGKEITPQERKNLVKEYEDIFMRAENLPDDVKKTLNIDVSSTRGLDQAKQKIPGAEKLLPTLDAMEMEARSIAVNLMTQENGDIKSVKEFEKDALKIIKVLENMDSGDKDIRREAYIEYATLFRDAEGNKIEDPEAAIKSIQDRFKLKDVATLSTAEYKAVIQLETEIVGLEERIAYWEAMAIGGEPSERADAAEKAKALKSAKKVLRRKQRSIIKTSTGGGGKGGSGGGGGAKSLSQTLTEDLKKAKEMFSKLQDVVSADGFKAFIAGPFAPEFLDYLRQQGDEGLKILKGNLAKVKEEYAKFEGIQRKQIASQALISPFMRREQNRRVAARGRFTQGLAGQGLTTGRIDYVNQQISDEEIAYYNDLKSMGRRGRKKAGVQEDFKAIQKNIKRATKQSLTAVREEQQQAFDASMRQTEENFTLINELSARGIDPSFAQDLIQSGIGIESLGEGFEQAAERVKKSKLIESINNLRLSLSQMGKEVQLTQKLSSMGFFGQMADDLKSAGVTADMSAEHIKDTAAAITLVKMAAEAAKDPLDKMSDALDGQVRLEQSLIESYSRNTLDPLQDQLDGINEIIQAKQRDVELEQRKKEQYQDNIDSLNDEEDKIQEAYDARIEALDKVEKINERIARQQQSQLDVASALSRGDIAGAAQAAMAAKQEEARSRIEEARGAITAQFEADKEAIQEKVKANELEIEAIDNRIKDIQDAIVAKQDEAYDKQKEINDAKKLQMQMEEKLYKLQLMQNLLQQQRAVMDAARTGNVESVKREQEILGAQLRAAGDNPASFFEGISGGADVAGAAATTAGADAQTMVNQALSQISLTTDKINEIMSAAGLKFEEGVAPTAANMVQAFADANLNIADYMLPSTTDMVDNTAIAGENTAIMARITDQIVQGFQTIRARINERIKDAYSAVNAINAKIQEARAAAAAASAAASSSSQKKAFGGMINYKGSTEKAPGFMYGGKMKKFAYGSVVPGVGMTDKVPALLTPGEFVVRKSVAQQYGPLLSAINSNVFPKMNGSVMPKSSRNTADGIQYNYDIDVNVAGTNASPDEIAQAVMYRIKRIDDRQVRGTRLG